MLPFTMSHCPVFNEEGHGMRKTSLRTLFGAVAGVGVLTLALSACSGSSTPAESSGGGAPFQLLVVAAQSGPLADAGGIPATQGIKTIMRLVNEDGGIDGRQVTVNVVDSASDATQAVSNVQAWLANNPAPDAVFSGVFSSEALPVTPITTQAGLLSVCSCVSPAVTDPTKFPYSFTSGYYSTVGSAALLDQLKKKGYKKVAYGAADNESGHAQVKALTDLGAAAGIQVVSAFMPVDAVDASPMLETLRAQSPDALVLYAPATAIPVQLSSRTKIGWDLPTYVDVASSTAPIAKTTSQADWKNVLLQVQNLSVVGTPMTTSEGYKRFSEAYKADWGPTSLDVTGFALIASPAMAALTVKAAYEASDGSTGADLAKALQSIGPDPIPDSIASLYFGPDPLGYSATNHAVSWAPDDFSYVPIAPLQNGLLPQ
jgi:branched-chain amino acid transport system substrate-binding protein